MSTAARILAETPAEVQRERRTRAGMTATTRRLLVDIGRNHFGEFGYNEISLEGVAAEAGLTRGALYHQFGSKLGLFCAVVDDIDQDIDRRFAAQIEAAGTDSSDFWETTRIASRCYLEAFRSAHIRRIMIKDAPNYYPDFSRRPSRLHNHKNTVRTLKQWSARDGFAMHPDAMVSMLEGAIAGLFDWAMEFDPDFDDIQNQADSFLSRLALTDTV